MINILKVVFISISVFMTYLAIHTSLRSDMFHLPQAVLNEPWFWATLVDFYFNIIIISACMIYKENQWLRSLLWVIAFICLGSIATSFYVFLQLMQLKKGEGLQAVLLRRN